MRRRHLPGPCSPRQAAALWSLVAALLLGQWLGALHRVVHATGAPAVPGVVLPNAAGPAAAGTEPGIVLRSLLARLFAGHGKVDCVLFDQALQPSPVAVPATLPLPPLATAAPPLAPTGVALSGGASSFEARAPPP